MEPRAGSPSGGDPGAIGARLAAITTGLAVAASTLLIAGHLLNELAFDGSVGELSAKAEGNGLTWASTVAAFGGALAAGLAGLLVRAHRVKLGLLAAALALISFDDLVRVHERLGGRVAEYLDLPDAIAEGVELLLLGPLLLTVLVAGWLLAAQLPTALGGRLRVGLGLLLGAAAVEVFGAPTRAAAEAGTGWPNELRIALEEGIELAGLIMVAGALVILLCESLLRAGAGLGLGLESDSEPTAISERAPAD